MVDLSTSERRTATKAARRDSRTLSAGSVVALAAVMGLFIGQMIVSAVSAAVERNALIDAATLPPLGIDVGLRHLD